MRILRLASLLAAVSAAAAGPAQAQSHQSDAVHSSSEAGPDVIEMSGSTIRAMTARQARVAELEKDYDQINLGPPRAGLVVSSVVFILGGVMVFYGAVGVGLGSGLGSEAQTGYRALAAAGAMVSVSGIVGLAVAGKRLRRKKHERLRIQEELADARRGTPDSSAN